MRGLRHSAEQITREYRTTDAAQNLKVDDVLERPTSTIATRGVHKHIRSDNGPEVAARVVRDRLKKVGVKTLFIEPGSPWETGYIESVNGKPRDKLLNRERFDRLNEGQDAHRAATHQ